MSLNSTEIERLHQEAMLNSSWRWQCDQRGRLEKILTRGCKSENDNNLVLEILHYTRLRMYDDQEQAMLLEDVK